MVRQVRDDKRVIVPEREVERLDRSTEVLRDRRSGVPALCPAIPEQPLGTLGRV
jgi:hypothetical protein